jgi:hypothetical protein
VIKQRKTAGTMLTTALVLVACARPGTPQVQGPLAIEIGELCTVCVEVLRYEGAGRRTVYVLDEKSAWAQIATIGDYLVQSVRPKTEDFRALTIYELGADGRALGSCKHVPRTQDREFARELAEAVRRSQSEGAPP